LSIADGAPTLIRIKGSRVGARVRQRLPDWPDTDEGKDAALQALQPVRPEVPAVDQRRHAHRHDGAGGAALEQRLPSATVRAVREPGAERLLEDALQQGWHHPQPQRIYDHQMLCPPDRLLRRGDGRRRRSLLKISQGPQQRKLQLCNLDAFDLQPESFRAGRIGVGKRVAEPITCRIGVALDDGDAPRHDR
jgi:hypothetical protein